MTNAQKIKELILDIGKVNITFDKKGQNYLFNGQSPRALGSKHFEKLEIELLKRLDTQLIENCDKQLLEKYIDYTKIQLENVKEKSNLHRVNFLMRRKDYELSDLALDTHEDIRSIISTINTILSKFRLELEDKLEFVGYKTKNDYQEEANNRVFNTNNIPFSDAGRMTFKMSKKESLLLLYVMENQGLIEFESEGQRIKFLESNFKYTEVRNNKNQGKSFPMAGVNSEISVFKSYTEAKSNNKVLERVLKKLSETIHLHQFK